MYNSVTSVWSEARVIEIFQGVTSLVTSFTSVCNIDKINMENDCDCANLEDKYTFIFKEKQKVAV